MPDKQEQEMAKAITTILFTYSLPAEEQILHALKTAYKLGQLAGMDRAERIMFEKQPEVSNQKTK